MRSSAQRLQQGCQRQLQPGRCHALSHHGARIPRRSQRQATVNRTPFEPPAFNPAKLTVAYELGCTPLAPPPLDARRYTLTHNDLTGALQLSIGRHFNLPQLSGWYVRLLRDEVLAEWCAPSDGGPLELHVYCHVSGQERWLAPPQLRNYIFKREMPLVLDTLAWAERDLLLAYPRCADANVFVHLNSTSQDLHCTVQWGRLGYRDTWRRTPTSILQRLLHAWRPTPAWFGMRDPADAPVPRRRWKLDDSMDEEEAAELFSASGANGAGPSSTDALPSIQAAAAIEAVGHNGILPADFPAVAAVQLPEAATGADDVALLMAAQQQAAEMRQEAHEPGSFSWRTAAAATAAAAQAQQDPLVTEALEAAQQQRQSSLSVSRAGNGASLLCQDSLQQSDSDGGQPCSLGRAFTADRRSADSGGSQPSALRSDKRPQAAQQPQSPTGASRRSSLDGESSSWQGISGRGDPADRREDDSNSSVHSVQLLHAWPSHPGAVVGREQACCIASQHQQQPRGRMWD